MLSNLERWESISGPYFDIADKYADKSRNSRYLSLFFLSLGGVLDFFHSLCGSPYGLITDGFFAILAFFVSVYTYIFWHKAHTYRNDAEFARRTSYWTDFCSYHLIEEIFTNMQNKLNTESKVSREVETLEFQNKSGDRIQQISMDAFRNMYWTCELMKKRRGITSQLIMTLIVTMFLLLLLIISIFLQVITSESRIRWLFILLIVKLIFILFPLIVIEVVNTYAYYTRINKIKVLLKDFTKFLEVRNPEIYDHKTNKRSLVTFTHDCFRFLQEYAILMVDMTNTAKEHKKFKQEIMSRVDQQTERIFPQNVVQSSTKDHKL